MSFSMSTILPGPIVADAVSALIMLFFGWLAVRRAEVMPGRMQNFLEIILETFEGLISQMAKPAMVRRLSFLGTVTFSFLLIANILGLLPTLALGLHSPTADINTPAGMAAGVFLLVQAEGIWQKGFLGYLKWWVWSPVPIFGLLVNALEQLFMPLSLAFRLFGNILAGERVMEIIAAVGGTLAGWLVVGIVGTLWLAFSNFVSVIQALIFTILMLAYISIITGEGHC